MINKLKSRKFILSAISLTVGIVSIFVGENETLSAVASMLMVVVPSVVYCITEGKIDAESAKNIKNSIDTLGEKVLDENKANLLKSATDLAEITFAGGENDEKN